MGRAKQYDRTELLDRAVELFRRQGFHGTTTAELADVLDVNRKSMYAEFGSKQGLFLAALEHYSTTHLASVLAPIEAPDASAAAIRKTFDAFASAGEGRFRGRGCLLCNTAVERGALDPESGRHVEAYLERITRGFRRALGNAADAGEIECSANLDDLAAFFTTMLIGVAACVRAEAPAERIRAATRIATSLLAASPN